MGRIVVVGMSEGVGGVESYLLNFLRSVRPQHEVIFVSLKPGVPLAYMDQLEAAGASIFEASGPYSLTSYFGRSRRAQKILRYLHADVVYVNALTPNFAYWVRAAQRLHIHAVFHAHSDQALYSSVLKHLVTILARPYNLVTLRRCIQLTTSVPAAAYMFGRHNHAEMIYNAIDPKRWNFQPDQRKKMRETLHLPVDAKVIIAVARMAAVKNYPKIVRVFNALYQQDPTCRLLLAGDGPERSQIEALVKSLRLEDEVQFLGFRSDIPQLMWASDILLVPSLFEGLPFTLIEAQGAGLPVLATANVMPPVANVTGSIATAPLNASNQAWAAKLAAIVPRSEDERLMMNRQIADSDFSLAAYDEQIQQIFSFLN